MITAAPGMRASTDSFRLTVGWWERLSSRDLNGRFICFRGWKAAPTTIISPPSFVCIHTNYSGGLANHIRPCTHSYNNTPISELTAVPSQRAATPPIVCPPDPMLVIDEIILNLFQDFIFDTTIMKKIAAIILIALALTGCGPRLVYHHLDWLIPWYVSDYITLDSDQKNLLEERLAMLLDWHCRTQLPVYAVTLRELGRDLANGADPVGEATLQAYNRKIILLWKELLAQIGPDITAILATASDVQIKELFDNLAKQNQKFRKKFVDPPPGEADRRRQDRMIKRLKYWLSDLNPDQIQAVAEWSLQLTPIAEQWIQNREVIQAKARSLLDRRFDNPEFRSNLQALIIHPEKMRSVDYQRKIDINTRITITLIVRLEQMLTKDQRSHLLTRIESLAADFDTLSCDPTTLLKPPVN